MAGRNGNSRLEKGVREFASIFGEILVPGVFAYNTISRKDENPIDIFSKLTYSLFVPSMIDLGIMHALGYGDKIQEMVEKVYQLGNSIPLIN